MRWRAIIGRFARAQFETQYEILRLIAVISYRIHTEIWIRRKRFIFILSSIRHKERFIYIPTNEPGPTFVGLTFHTEFHML